MWWWILGFYIAGVVGTALLNLHLIIGPANPVTVMRNALLWPVFLPILLMMSFF